MAFHTNSDVDLSVVCGHADGSVSVWTAQGQLRFRIESSSRSSMTCFDVAEDQSIAVAGYIKRTTAHAQT
jgi:hypothetical protein